MAGIDKIYGSQQDYITLRAWLMKHRPQALGHLYPEYGYDREMRPISNFPTGIDKWLAVNCPFGFVQRKLRIQYPREYDQWRKEGKPQTTNEVDNLTGGSSHD